MNLTWLVRLGLIAHHAAPVAAPFAGGLEAMTWYLARWLARRGHEVVLFAPPGSAVPGVEVAELDLEPPLTDLARRDVSMPPDRFMSAHHAYQRLMADLVHRPRGLEVIHVHALHYLPVAMAEISLVPMVMTLHSPPTPWLESALRAGHRRPRMVAVSHAMARLWSRSVEVDAIIPNGVDLDTWSEGPGGHELAWSGRIVPEKAPHLALDAARQAGLTLNVAGPVIDRAYFRREVAPRLGARARYVGHLSHPDLVQLVAGSRAMLQTPVWDEPFGLTAAESISTGTPVASFSRGGLPEVVGRDGGVLVAPDDVGALADAARRAGALPRARVREHARTTLSLDRMGVAYERLYERVARRARPAGLDPMTTVAAAPER